MANFWEGDSVDTPAPAQPAQAQQAPSFYSSDPVVAASPQQQTQPQVAQQPAPKQQSVVDKLTGTNGPRYQLWPERLARTLAGAAGAAFNLPGQYIEEQTQPKTSVSDSDVSVLSVPNAMNFAAFATPTSPASASIKTGATRAVAPTREELEAAKTAAYNDPAVMGLRLKPAVGQNIVDQVKSQMIKNNYDPVNAPNVLKTIGNLAEPRFESGAFKVADLDLARQSLSDVPHEQVRAASIARKVLDNYLSSIPEADVLAGDAATANAKLLEARGNAAALFRDQEISNALGRAETQAGSTYSGTNLDNATRQKLRPILNDKLGISTKKKVFQDYTPEEVDALRNAVNGTVLGNTVRASGKLVGAGHGIGAGIAAIEAARSAHEMGAPLPMAIATGASVGAGGYALNQFGNYLTRRNGDAIAELLRMRSPLAEQMMPRPVTLPMPQIGSPMLGYNFGRPMLGLMPAGANPNGQ